MVLSPRDLARARPPTQIAHAFRLRKQVSYSKNATGRSGGGVIAGTVAERLLRHVRARDEPVHQPHESVVVGAAGDGAVRDVINDDRVADRPRRTEGTHDAAVEHPAEPARVAVGHEQHAAD